MAQFKCSFCRKQIRTKDLADLPESWGVVIGKQGECSIEFNYCPEHEKYKNLPLWDLIEKERSTPPSKASPHPF